MNCLRCGAPALPNAPACAQCGNPADPAPGNDAVVRMLLPVGRSGWAIAAGYAGLFGLLVFPAPLALLLGVIAVLDIRRHPEKHGMGRAIFGIVAGLGGSALLAAIYLRPH